MEAKKQYLPSLKLRNSRILQSQYNPRKGSLGVKLALFILERENVKKAKGVKILIFTHVS
jgi:hypothetical protein